MIVFAPRAHRMQQRQHMQAFESVLPLWLRHHASRRRRSRLAVAVQAMSLPTAIAAAQARPPRPAGPSRQFHVAAAPRAHGELDEHLPETAERECAADDSPVPPTAGHSSLHPIAYQERRF